MATPFKVTDPLEHAVSAQVQRPIESAITIGETVYPNFNLHKTTVLDVKHEFATVIATLDQLASTYKSMPLDSENHSGLTDHIIEGDLGSKDGAVAAAIVRTAGAIRCLSKPVSHEDGLALTKCYKEFRDRVGLLHASCHHCLGGLEEAAPGLVEYCIYKLEELVTASKRISSVRP